MRYLIPCIIAAILLFAAGCTGQVTPSPEPKPVPPTQTVNDFDSCVAAGNPVMESYPRQCRHGSRTYTEVIDTPIEPPDTPPEPLPDEPLVGADEDEHGCKGSAGYQWCEATQKCQRFWEEPCDSELRQKAQEFCTHEGVSYVGTCGDFIKVTSNLPGAGTRFYYTDGEELECPLVAPEYMTEDCKNAASSECKDICTVTEDPKQLAEILAINYVQKRDEYQDYDGRNIMATNVAVMRCPGCYDVEVRFERDSAAGDETIHALAHVEIANFEAVDVTFAFDETDYAPTCEDQCGDGQCAEIVCAAIGCPCHETPGSCPEDCA